MDAQDGCAPSLFVMSVHPSRRHARRLSTSRSRHHATHLADDAGVVAVPPAAVQVQIGEFIGQHRRLVLRDARQEGGEEFDLCVLGLIMVDGEMVIKREWG